jgi:anti-sigma B factor antagonist
VNEIWHHSVARAGGTCTVVLSGELDMSVTDQLLTVLLDEVSRPDTRVVRADLDAVEFIDSSGMRALINAYHAAEGLDRRFVVVRPRRNVRKALDVTGLLSILADGAPPAFPAAVDRPTG